MDFLRRHLWVPISISHFALILFIFFTMSDTVSRSPLPKESFLTELVVCTITQFLIIFALMGYYVSKLFEKRSTPIMVGLFVNLACLLITTANISLFIRQYEYKELEQPLMRSDWTGDANEILEKGEDGKWHWVEVKR